MDAKTARRLEKSQIEAAIPEGWVFTKKERSGSPFDEDSYLVGVHAHPPGITDPAEKIAKSKFFPISG